MLSTALDQLPVFNVVQSRAHIDNPSNCTRIDATSHKLWTLYTNGDKQFRKDENATYHYKGQSFTLDDGYLVIDTNRVSLPGRITITTVERLLLSLGRTINSTTAPVVDIQDRDMRTIFHMLTMLSLKDLGIISNQFQLTKQKKYGEVVFESCYESVRGSGRIRSTNKAIRWLNEQDTLQLKAKLFKLSDSKKYKVGSYSMKYTSTSLAQKIMSKMFDLLKAVDFVHNEIKLEPLDFIVSIELLSQIKLRDVMLLLGNCIGFNCGFIIRPVVTDYQFSRVYSVFTSVSSDTRKQLGFHNHDIGSALQTICLQLVEDSSIYPLHQELMDDKKVFRTKVMNETAQDMKWVKKELSKIDNIDNMPKRYNHYPILKAYYEEAQILRKEIISTAEPTLLHNAQEFAKNKWDKFWNEEESKYEFEINEDEYKESSLFFFIWTQWERQIREIMMKCFDKPEACHQVHDAVYSTQQIDPSIIEANILEYTGFEVRISA